MAHAQMFSYDYSAPPPPPASAPAHQTSFFSTPPVFSLPSAPRTQSEPYPFLGHARSKSVVLDSDASTRLGEAPLVPQRQRTTVACNKCRERKTKCNGEKPVCQRCASRGLICQYAKDTRNRHVPSLSRLSQTHLHSDHSTPLGWPGPNSKERRASVPNTQSYHAQQQHHSLSRQALPRINTLMNGGTQSQPVSQTSSPVREAGGQMWYDIPHHTVSISQMHPAFAQYGVQQQQQQNHPDQGQNSGELRRVRSYGSMQLDNIAASPAMSDTEINNFRNFRFPASSEGYMSDQQSSVPFPDPGSIPETYHSRGSTTSNAESISEPLTPPSYAMSYPYPFGSSNPFNGIPGAYAFPADNMTIYSTGPRGPSSTPTQNAVPILANPTPRAPIGVAKLEEHMLTPKADDHQAGRVQER